MRPSDATDFVTLGLGVFMGRLLGVVIAIPVGVTHISLSTSLGTLLMGLLVGWLRSVRPVFGRIADGARVLRPHPAHDLGTVIVWLIG